MGVHAKPFIAMFANMLETDMRPLSIKKLSEADVDADYRIMLRLTALETAISMLESTIRTIKGHLSPDDVADILIALTEFQAKYEKIPEPDPQHACKIECLNFCIDELTPVD